MAFDRRKETAGSSGFFFDVERWFGSVSAQRMSFAEKGVYLVMMFQEWRDHSRSLPDDPAAVAEMIAVTDAQAADVLAAWTTVRKKFTTCDREPGRIFNAGIERTRRIQAQYHKTRATAGRKGGLARAGKQQQKQELEAKQSLSSAQAKPSDLTRSDLNRHDLTRSDLKEHDLWRARFDAFWAAYPKKVGKDDALKAWRKRKPSDALLTEMLSALEWQVPRWSQSELRFTPNPATWLNRGQWQDEPPSQVSLLSDTARYNLASAEEATRLIEEAERGRETEH